ncbi:hypothetical protein D3C80_1618570 [compost metagenome]
MLSISSAPSVLSMPATRSRLQLQANRGASSPTWGSKRTSFSSQNRRRRMVSTSSVSSSSCVRLEASVAMRLYSSFKPLLSWPSCALSVAAARLASPLTGMRCTSRPAATWSLAASTSTVSSCSDCSM